MLSSGQEALRQVFYSNYRVPSSVTRRVSEDGRSVTFYGSSTHLSPVGQQPSRRTILGRTPR